MAALNKRYFPRTPTTADLDTETNNLLENMGKDLRDLCGTVAPGAGAPGPRDPSFEPNYIPWPRPPAGSLSTVFDENFDYAL